MSILFPDSLAWDDGYYHSSFASSLASIFSFASNQKMCAKTYESNFDGSFGSFSYES